MPVPESSDALVLQLQVVLIYFITKEAFGGGQG